jgi:glycosyltransferase involved in cell wall biosynthesis
VPSIKQHTSAPVLVTLQGDDIFLEDLPEPFKSQAFAEIRKLVRHVDGFIVNSRYYADFMADYFGIPPEKFHITPLGIDTEDFLAAESSPATHETSKLNSAPDERTLKVGYFARLAPEKGLHVLVDAFLELRRMPGMERTELHIAGWLGEHRRKYAEEQFDKLRAAGLGDAFHYAGSVDRRGKVEFLRRLDVLSVPTVYHEPKGLFVLEALAAGVPVVEPSHGAFPELVEATGGGRLVNPGDPRELARALYEVLTDDESRLEMARRGRESVLSRYNSDAMARLALEIYATFAPDLLPHASQPQAAAATFK